MHLIITLRLRKIGVPRRQTQFYTREMILDICWQLQKQVSRLWILFTGHATGSAWTGLLSQITDILPKVKKAMEQTPWPENGTVIEDAEKTSAELNKIETDITASPDKVTHLLNNALATFRRALLPTPAPAAPGCKRNHQEEQDDHRVSRLALMVASMKLVTPGEHKPEKITPQHPCYAISCFL